MDKDIKVLVTVLFTLTLLERFVMKKLIKSLTDIPIHLKGRTND